MRCIDADALEKEGWSLHRTIRVDKNTDEYQTKPLRKVPTIEPRCEECEAFNKTRLLVPQPQRKKGKWKMALTKDLIGFNTVCFHCSECNGMEYSTSPFCRVCGAKMEEGEEN